MDDLFEQLKAAPPVNKNVKTPPKISATSESFIRSLEKNANSSPRRESMPPPNSPIIFKSIKANKSRSMSPPKFGKLSQTKPFKVMLGRKKFGSANTSSAKNQHSKSLPAIAIEVAEEAAAGDNKKLKTPVKSNALLELFKSPKNILSLTASTPTKAQQKEFGTVPNELSKPRKKPHPNKKKIAPVTKRCVVRLPRQNLNKLQKEYKKKLKQQNGKLKATQSKSPSPPKRKSMNTIGSPPAKRGRKSLSISPKDSKPQTAFFIKLSTSTTNLLGIKKSAKKLEKATIKTDKKITKLSPKPSSKLRNKSPSPSFSTHSTKSSPSGRIKPTKFTRTQLIKAFGKRVFKSHVKIEKCRHPLMLIFDSNARARKLQAKSSKNKNLSVSFREQVEVFGTSDTDEQSDEDANDVEYTPKSSGSKKSFVMSSQSNSGVEERSTPPVTPARLKKVENGKVIDDIEFDPSLFIASSSAPLAGNAANSSTPYSYSPGRKRREKKSFSPLKGDATPSPRKEQFKLANEKLPPSYLRRMNVDDVDEEDDDDDDCEYIVPIDFPQRRSSRASSTNANESSGSFVSANEEFPEDTPKIAESEENMKLKEITKETSRSDLASPTKLEPTVKESLEEGKLEVLPKLMRIHDSPSLNMTKSAAMLINSSLESVAAVKEVNSDKTSELEAEPELPAYSKSEQDILMELFEKGGTENLDKNTDILSEGVVGEEDVIENILKESIQDIDKNVPVVPISSEESTSSIKFMEVATVSNETLKSSDD